MEFLKFVIFAVFCTLATSASPVERKTYTTCGQILTESTGGISYKPFEPYGSFGGGERCVWIIRVPQAVQYTFNFYNLGYVYSVRVVSLGLNQEFDQYASVNLGRNYTTDANVLVVTLTSSLSSSGPGKDNGFSMWYTSVVDESFQISPNSIDSIISTPNSLQIRHSPTNLEYSNNELSVFVFAPNFLYESNKQTRLHYTRLGWDGVNCDDKIEMWDIAASATWRPLGKICGADKDLMITNKNMILMVFKTNASGVGSGFTLDYTYEA